MSPPGAYASSLFDNNQVNSLWSQGSFTIMKVLNNHKDLIAIDWKWPLVLPQCSVGVPLSNHWKRPGQTIKWHWNGMDCKKKFNWKRETINQRHFNEQGVRPQGLSQQLIIIGSSLTQSCCLHLEQALGCWFVSANCCPRTSHSYQNKPALGREIKKNHISHSRADYSLTWERKITKMK